MEAIITISGQAQHGKDTLGGLLKNKLELFGKKAQIVHYGDYLKYIATQYYGWDGVKDEKGRSLLQWLGTEQCRANSPDIWVNVVSELVLGMYKAWDVVIIPDCRFRNEIERLWDTFAELHQFNLKVERYEKDGKEFDNGLTPEQKLHPSERDLDHFDFDAAMVVTNITNDLRVMRDWADNFVYYNLTKNR
jgi:hypothetical protein